MISEKYSHDAQSQSEVGTIQLLRADGLTSGYWTATPKDAPEPFSQVLECNETLVLLSGKLGVADGRGMDVTLSAGDSVSLEPGTTVTWTIYEPLVKFWVHH